MCQTTRSMGQACLRGDTGTDGQRDAHATLVQAGIRAHLAGLLPMARAHTRSRGTHRMDTSSLVPPPTHMVPDNALADQAPAHGPRRHPDSDRGSGQGGRPPQAPPAVGSRPRRPWQRCVNWSSLGLLVSVVGGAAWLVYQPPLAPPDPRIHGALAASAFPGAVAPPAPSPSPAGHAALGGAPPGGASPDPARQRPPASLARGGVLHRSKAVTPPRAARGGPLPHAQRPQATSPGRMGARVPVGGAYRPGAWSTALPAPHPSSRQIAPHPAPEGERSPHWHSIPATEDG